MKIGVRVDAPQRLASELRIQSLSERIRKRLEARQRLSGVAGAVQHNSAPSWRRGARRGVLAMSSGRR